MVYIYLNNYYFMKNKIPIFFIISLALFVLSLNFVFADVVLGPEYHYVTSCLKLDNLNEFPEINLVGYTTGPVGGGRLYLINENQCLQFGRYGGLNVYAVDKNYLNGKNLEDIYVPSDKNFIISNLTDFYNGGYVNNTNPLKSQNSSYKILGFSGNKFIFYESERISSYTNGSIFTETFSKPIINDLRSTIKTGDIPNPTPVVSPTPEPRPNPVPTPIKKSFFQSIGCFFTQLFGGKC